MSISAPASTGPRGPLAAGVGGTPGLSLPSFPPLRIPGLTEPLPEQGPREAAPPPQDPTTAFLASARSPRDPRLPVILDPPLSATQLDAGSLIPAVLATGINSDLPGDLVAQVSRDVFDSRTERRVLIPKGSRLLGRYQNQVATGQHRLLVAWDRLIFPDGTSLRFPGLPGTSGSGEAGLPGAVDNHLPTVFGSALLLSLLSAGVQLSQPQESATFGQAASTRQVGAAALGQELSTVATELLRRRLAIAPTLRIPSGTEFQVFVRADLALAPYR
jgi:type IV secretion system protein VirB10